MPALGPVNRRDLIQYLQQLGFSGPYSGGKHQFMLKGSGRLYIPNPHQGDVGKELLLRLLRQASIDPADWEQL